MLNCRQIHVELGDGSARIAKQHYLGRETLGCARAFKGVKVEFPT